MKFVFGNSHSDLVNLSRNKTKTIDWDNHIEIKKKDRNNYSNVFDSSFELNNDEKDKQLNKMSPKMAEII